ncbi:hypothetical protein FRB98_007149 [Tulasnella sp. 332]|nr:hypothetical protein FRB98_007149 [Tulasnella sp. 332]
MPDKAATRAMNSRYLSTQCSSTYDITHAGQSIANVTLAANMLIHDLLHEVNGCAYAPYPVVADGAARAVVLGSHQPVMKQRYEFLGDKFLALFIGELLSEAFPLCNGEASAPTGLLHLAHGELRSNLLFSLLAVKHGMAKAPFLKASANTFEAYVHVLRIDANICALQPWLRRIFEPLIRFFVKNYVLKIRTFEEFQAVRFPARIQLRAGVASDNRGRHWRGVLWTAKAPSQAPITASSPSIPKRLVTDVEVQLDGAAERRKVDGRITAIMDTFVEVRLHKLHLPEQPRIWLRRCSEVIENYKFDKAEKCITITWKPPPRHHLEADGFEIEDEDEENDIIIESHSSILKEGSMIPVGMA